MPDYVPHQSNGLPPPKRYVTSFDENGRSIIEKSVNPELQWTNAYDKDALNAQFTVGYVTKGFPIDFANDLDFYNKSQEEGISVTMPGGIVLRIVDLLPGTTSPMHRTSSIDYGIVLKGQVESILDSGESVYLNEHDVFVQRGTMHAWRNTSETEPARMVYFLCSAKPITTNGQTLKEDLGDIGGVPKNE